MQKAVFHVFKAITFADICRVYLIRGCVLESNDYFVTKGAPVTDDVTTPSSPSPQHTEGDEQNEQPIEQQMEQQIEQQMEQPIEQLMEQHHVQQIERQLEQEQQLEQEHQLDQEELQTVVNTNNDHDLSVCVTSAMMTTATTTVSTVRLLSYGTFIVSAQSVEGSV